MNDFRVATVPQGGIKEPAFLYETCPSCSGHIVLQDDGKGGIEEVCESCGPIAMLLVDAPKENNPPPVDPKDAGEAPIPQGLMVFGEQKPEKVKKNVHRPDK